MNENKYGVEYLMGRRNEFEGIQTVEMWYEMDARVVEVFFEKMDDSGE